MTKKSIQSFSTCSLAAGQCLLLSLYLSTVPLSGAWIHSSVVTRTNAGCHSKSIEKSRRNTPTSLAVGNGVMDFVNGLDSALGNPTASSAASQAQSVTTPAMSSSVASLEATGGAVNMNIPNSLVLAGGGVAVLTFLGLAFYFMTQQGGGDNTNQEPVDMSMSSFGIEEVAPLPKVSIDENALSRQLEVAETEEQQENPPPIPAASEDTSATDFGDDETENPPPSLGEEQETLDEEKNLSEETGAKLESLTKELTENRELLASETERRKDAELKLDEATTANEGLKEKLAKQVQTLSEMTEKWGFTKTKLQEETKLREAVESELKVAAESNRVLEDKYELEQNTVNKTKKELERTQETLGKTQGRLERTQGQLTRVHGELQITKQKLREASGDVAKLEEEKRSIRTLGKTMWRLSKSRVQNRMQSVGDRLRGRGPKKNKKPKKS